MEKKSNMKQAMFEMFGVGEDQNANDFAAKKEAAPVKKEEPKNKQAAPAVKKAPEKAPEKAPAAAPKAEFPVSYLAPGTIIEGTLRAEGNLEIAGEVKGDISTKGTAVLLSNVHGNVNAHSLKLSGCNLTGDVIAEEVISVSADSIIRGNVTARSIKCAGQIVGDLKIADNTSLEGTAQITGNIITGSISVVQGALIKGGIEMQKANEKGNK